MARITFNSQEDFEDAVMAVLDKRLRIKIDAPCDTEHTKVFLVDQYSDKHASVITRDSL